MAETTDPRVAVYIDFDNIVISRYDQRSKRGQFHTDKARSFDPAANPDSDVTKRLEKATVDLGAILDFASSFGTIAISRAYADWSATVNASYRRQLIERAVDLVQLFPTVASMKNGADIRLAVDVVEDLFRLPDLTHVVIVAGDSDYVALAQRSKQLGRYVVGIGVAGSTSKALGWACDEFADYDALPGVNPVVEEPEPAEPATREPRSRSGRRSKPKSAQDSAADLLVRALELGRAKTDDEWQASGTTKNQMLRMDPTFQERALGYKSFTEFVQSLDPIVELDDGHPSRRMRLRAVE
ncbi:NYN domain-containing protein [Marisediminicola sp. LYQ134]|uniref:NYN domain-containing protein n=1 Tax=Marisediminicola sp. LYQ134 TaxID=3391061 RepID=UPI00398308E6